MSQLMAAHAVQQSRAIEIVYPGAIDGSAAKEKITIVQEIFSRGGVGPAPAFSRAFVSSVSTSASFIGDGSKKRNRHSMQ